MRTRRAMLVVDLAFGDCGKGTIVDFLALTHHPATVVRFNGGPQAAHNVVTPDGRHHTFAQFGSGTFVPAVQTFLSRFMLIEPYALLNESLHLADLGLADPLGRLLIDARCKVITPAHQAANRLREIARGDKAHGTCGMGIGEAMRDSLEFPDLVMHAGDLRHRSTVIAKLRAIQALKAEQLREIIQAFRGHRLAEQNISTLLADDWIDVAADNYMAVADRARVLDAKPASEVLRDSPTLIFEGAQGVLLDERFGFRPHTTWSTTTFANADTLLDEAGYEDRRIRIGVLRTYFTRHGPGPLVTENLSLRAALPEPHNADTGWQGRFRIGEFDAVAVRYALAVAGPVDLVAMTHVDRIRALPNRICTGYREEADRAESANNGEDSFVRDGDRILDIRPRCSANLSQSDRLTHQLRNCRPLFSPLAHANAGDVIRAVEQEIRSPVGILSSGPTAQGKKIVTSRI